jgi:hypothetical protein
MEDNLLMFIILIISLIIIFYFYSHSSSTSQDPIHVAPVFQPSNPSKEKKKESKTLDVDHILKNPKINEVISSPKLHTKSDLKKNQESEERSSKEQTSEKGSPKKSKFFSPIIGEKEKQEYFDKLRKDHEKQVESLLAYGKYVKEMPINKKEVPDPFDSGNKEYFQGKTIQAIYDEQVGTHKRNNKKPQHKPDLSENIYSEDNEMNNYAMAANRYKYNYQVSNFKDDF